MINVLFVCMGNICRSPAAEGIFKAAVANTNLKEIVNVDSAGTIGYHAGELPDPRMRRQAALRGYNLNSTARKFNPKEDFEKFDYIVTMDDDNYQTISNMDTKGLYKNKLFKMSEFITAENVTEVPDPYYGGDAGFEFVLDILEDGAQNLLKRIIYDFEQTN